MTTTVEESITPEIEQAPPVYAAEQLAKAKTIVQHNIAWSAGAGLLPFPALDLVAITGVQLKMINELCSAYNIPFKQSLARPIVISLIGSLGAAMLAPMIATASIKFIPGIGAMLAGTALAATSAGITYGVGHLFLDHFKNGGTLENFNVIKGRNIFKSKVKEGMQQETEIKSETVA